MPEGNLSPVKIKLKVSGLVCVLMVFVVLGSWRLNHPPVSPRLERAIIAATMNLDHGNYLPAASRFRRALSLDPNNEEAGKLYEIIRVTGYPFGRFTREFAFKRAKAVYPRYPDSPYMNMIAAEQYRLSGDTDTAINLHQMAVELDPGLPHNWYLLGLAYRADGRHNDATDALEKAVELHPGKRYTFELGQQYLFTGVYLKAIGAFQLTLRKTSFRIDPRIGTIRALIKSGQRQDALARARDLHRFLLTDTRKARIAARRAILLKGGNKFDKVSRQPPEDIVLYLATLIKWLESGVEGYPESTVSDSEPGLLGDILTFDFNDNPH